jgi:hypothetical protein
VYKRYVSVGQDPVLVFGERGKVRQMQPLDELFLPGCKFYRGRPQLARAHEVVRLERLWRTQAPSESAPPRVHSRKEGEV